MPRGSGRLVLDNFIGGVNVRDDTVNLDLNETPAAFDLVPFGEGGSVVQRDGDAVYRDLGLGNLRRLQRLNGVGRFVAYENAGKVVSFSTTSQTTLYDPAGGSQGQDGFWSVEAPASGGQGPVYFRAVDNVDNDILRQSSGTAASAAWTASAGTVPEAWWYLYVGNRVFAVRKINTLGTVLLAEASQLWWSELGDPRNWPAANTLQLAPADGEVLQAVGAIGDDLLVVFKESRAWVIYDLDTGANRALGGPDVGAESMDTTCSTSQGLFFIDPGRGPMVTDGYSAKALPNGTKAPWDRFSQVAYLDDHIYASDPLFGYVWDYDVKTQSWWTHTADYNFFAVNKEDSRIVAANDSSDTVDELFISGDVTNSAGANLRPIWDSPHLGLGAPAENKRLRSMRAIGTGTVDAKLKTEVGGSFTTKGTGALTVPGLEVPTLGVARAPQIELAKTNSATAMRLDQIILDYSTRQK